MNKWHSLTAGYVGDRSCDVAGLRRKQPKNRRRDLIRLPSGDFDAIDALRLATPGIHFGVDESRANRVDTLSDPD